MKFRLACLLFSLATAASAQVRTPQEVHQAVRAAGGAEPFLKEMVRQTANALPIRPNQNVEITSVVGLGKRIRYQSRLLLVESKASVHDMNALKSSNINYAACSSLIMSVMIKEYGAALTYVVLARNSEYLFEYELNSETCKGR
ncbi:hypothetical protein [Hydrogenophaga atypica]|uniref:Uncharacterized protein n=1 Tax=Hydrogenophaga atypica TaxID=249409 RepID=A0ABW2QR53_9BURK